MISSFSRPAASSLPTTVFTASSGRLAARTAAKQSRFSSTLPLPSPLRAEYNHSRLKWMTGSAVVATALLQAKYGSTSDFYEYRFTVDADPDDLSSFYGGEEFMELFCVMPWVGALMMRGGVFDENGTVHTTGFPGTLQVSMVFSDEADEDDKTIWFNKRERFKNVWLGERKMWDMVTNFGFQTLPDGRIECYHTGEYFHGNIPPISLLIRVLFQMHAQYVGWATEHHIKHHAFTAETEEEERMEEESRNFFLWHLVKNHMWQDAKALVFGKKEEAKKDQVKEESFEKELSTLIRDSKPEQPTIQPAPTVKIQPKLTIQRHATLRKIQKDILMDRALLHQNSMDTAAAKPGMDAYRKATVAARQRHETRRKSLRRDSLSK